MSRSHGHSVNGKPSPTYASWMRMRQRCLNPRSGHYPEYGGRGITICERWMQFENFLADMGERPTSMTLDRKNNNGNYEPGNCRWATAKQQALNRRKRRPLKHFHGKSIEQWAQEWGVTYNTARVRLSRQRRKSNG